MAGDSKRPMGHPRDVSRERAIAITGGDAGYFDLMKDCIALAARDGGRPRAGARHPRLRLDGGAARWCRAQGATLVVPQWDFDFPGRDKLKDGYKALTARPFLPRYFPGFDLYLWIDGDCWVQQGDAIALFLAARAHRRARPWRRRSIARCATTATPGASSPRSTVRLYEVVLRQGDGRAADPLSPDQRRRLRPRGRRAALGGLGRAVGRGAAALGQHDRPDRAQRPGL